MGLWLFSTGQKRFSASVRDDGDDDTRSVLLNPSLADVYISFSILMAAFLLSEFLCHSAFKPLKCETLQLFCPIDCTLCALLN